MNLLIIVYILQHVRGKTMCALDPPSTLGKWQQACGNGQAANQQSMQCELTLDFLPWEPIERVLVELSPWPASPVGS
jgi:hypothetical protein